MQSGLELPISIPPRKSRERLRSLHRQLRTAILEGRLQPGLRLPPTRVLAAEYGVSRNTVVAA
jgi:GntR family transcriptional regulator/MocR family aminotransferase